MRRHGDSVQLQPSTGGRPIEARGTATVGEDGGGDVGWRSGTNRGGPAWAEVGHGGWAG
jgi:hypothetical protein